MLQQYQLETRTSLRLPARTEAHDLAHVRLRREDVDALCRPASEMYAPIVALFSTRDAREPVTLRPSETLYVQLPQRDVDQQQEAGAVENVAANRRVTHQRAAHDPGAAEQESEAQHSAAQHSAAQHSAERDSAQPNARRRTPAWTPLRVVAHHSYVAGMRVSGIMHRAIVRLEFDRE
jgi:hypothetical protein